MRMPAIAAIAALSLAASIPAQDQEESQKSTGIVIGAPYGGPPRSYLGVGVREIDAELARQKKLSEERGVEITSVAEGSPAERAGLNKGDVVLEYNGQPVQGAEQFIRLVRETPAGRSATLRVSRDGSIMTLTAVIGACKNCGPFGPLGQIKIPDVKVKVPELPAWTFYQDFPNVYTTWRSGMLGIEAEALDSQLAEYFGVKEGVLVRSVKPDSAAAKAGLRAGDVIVKAGDTQVSKPREVTQAVRTASGKPVTLTVIRDKREATVTVTLDESVPQGRNIRRQIMHRPGAEL